MRTETGASAPLLRHAPLVVEAVLVLAWAVLACLTATSVPHGLLPTVLVVLAVVLRRVSLPATAIVAAVAGVLQLLGRDWSALVANPGYALVFYSLAVSGEARWRHVGLIGALASMPMGLIALRAWEGSTEWTLVLWRCLTLAALIAVFSVGGWMAGHTRRQSMVRAEQQLAAQQALAERRRLTDAVAQAEQRERMAGELHDVVGHSWAVVAAQADGARYALTTDPDAAARSLDVIAETAREAMTDLRDFLGRIRYREEPEAQVGPEQRGALLEKMRRAGLRLEVREAGRAASSATLQLVCQRVLAESLANVLKHGDLDRPVSVRIDWTGGLRLTVQNTVASHSRAGGAGQGVSTMRRRAGLVGGMLTADRQGDMWTVVLDVPRDPAPDEEGRA